MNAVTANQAVFYHCHAVGGWLARVTMLVPTADANRTRIQSPAAFATGPTKLSVSTIQVEKSK